MHSITSFFPFHAYFLLHFLFYNYLFLLLLFLLFLFTSTYFYYSLLTYVTLLIFLLLHYLFFPFILLFYFSSYFTLHALPFPSSYVSRFPFLSPPFFFCLLFSINLTYFYILHFLFTLHPLFLPRSPFLSVVVFILIDFFFFLPNFSPSFLPCLSGFLASLSLCCLLAAVFFFSLRCYYSSLFLSSSFTPSFRALLPPLSLSSLLPLPTLLPSYFIPLFSPPSNVLLPRSHTSLPCTYLFLIAGVINQGTNS